MVMASKPKKDVVSEIEYTPDLVDAIFRYLLNDTELSRAIKAMNEGQKPLSLQDLKAANPNKLHNDLCGFNKKTKLGLPNPAKDAVESWTK